MRAAINAGGLVGFLMGLVDGLSAAWFLRDELPFLSLAGGVAAATLVYGGAWVVGTLAVGILLHAWLARVSLLRRHERLFVLALSAGLFVEIYWWTRAFVFYGRPAFSPERLAAAGALYLVALASAFVAARVLAQLPRAARALLPACVTLFWLGGAVYLMAERAPAARGELNARNGELPNVLFVVVDALRADVLGAYGNQRVSTPVIDELAARGVTFERALVQAPFTWTSFGSFLTGKYPRRHGLVKMAPGVRMRQNVTLPAHLKSAERAAGGTLQDGDWLGGTFMTGTLSHGSGLMQGFDVYFEALVGHELVEVDRPWTVFRSELLLSLVKNKLTQRLDPSLVVTTARAWLSANAGKRFVAMVHLYSTHTPYDPEPEFRAMYCDPGYAGPVTAFYARHREAIERGEGTPTAADVEQIKNLYYAGVSQADRDIGIVLRELERQGVLDDTLVIVTADHGESLGEQNLWEHNHMVQTNLVVPLVMSWPERLPAGRRIDALVESVDVLPTVSDLLGLVLPAPVDADGRDAIDGKSLVPLIDGKAARVKEFSFAENGVFAAVQDLRWKLVVPHAALERAADSDGDLAGFVAPAGEAPRLFDLTADPAERSNRYAPEHAEARRLFAVLRDYDARMPIPLHDVVKSHRDLESERLLGELGYTGGVGQDIDPPGGGDEDERGVEDGR